MPANLQDYGSLPEIMPTSAPKPRDRRGRRRRRRRKVTLYNINAIKVLRPQACMPGGGTRSWQIPLRRSRLIDHVLGVRRREVAAKES